VELPFGLQEWARPPSRRTEPRVDPLNLLTSTLAEIAVAPFRQDDWATPQLRRRNPGPYPIPNLVVLQVAEALPVSQHQWPRPVYVRWGSSNRGFRHEGLTLLSILAAAADVTIHVRPEATIISVRPEATIIAVRPEPTDVEIP